MLNRMLPKLSYHPLLKRHRFRAMLNRIFPK